MAKNERSAAFPDRRTQRPSVAGWYVRTSPFETRCTGCLARIAEGELIAVSPSRSAAGSAYHPRCARRASGGAIVTPTEERVSPLAV